MRNRRIYCILVMLVAGCSASPENSQIVEQTVTVMTFDGQEQVVPLTEMYDAKSGEPAFKSVLAIDRQGNRKAFVPLDELKGESQANARYFPVTSSASTPPNSAVDDN